MLVWEDKKYVRLRSHTMVYSGLLLGFSLAGLADFITTEHQKEEFHSALHLGTSTETGEVVDAVFEFLDFPSQVVGFRLFARCQSVFQPLEA